MARRSVLLAGRRSSSRWSARPDRALRPGHRRACHRGPGARRGAGRHRHHRRRARPSPTPRRRASSRSARCAATTWSTAPCPRPARSPTSSPSARSTRASRSSPRSSARLGDTESARHPRRQDGHLGRAHRPRPRRRLRQPGLRGRDLRCRPTRSASCPTARSRRCRPTRASAPARGAGHRRRHDEHHLHDHDRPTRASRRPRRCPRAILTLAVDQKQAEKVIYAARNAEISFALLTEDSKVDRRRRRHGRRPDARDLPDRVVTAIVEPDRGAPRAAPGDAARLARLRHDGGARRAHPGVTRRVRGRHRPLDHLGGRRRRWPSGRGSTGPTSA